MKFVTTICLILALFSHLQAQRLPNTPVYSLNQFKGSFQWMKSMVTFNPEEIHGSMYGWESWPKGKIYMIDSLRYGDYPINIDLAESEVHVKEPYQGYLILLTKIVDKFTFFDSSQNRLRIFQKIPNDRVPLKPFNPAQTRDRFYEVLSDGKLKLLKLREKKLAPKDEMTTYAGTRKYDEYVERTAYFLQLETGEIKRLRLSAKGLSKLLPDIEREIKIYRKQENLYMGDEAGMVKMVSVLNRW